MKRLLSFVLVASALSASAHAQTRYILRYTESEPLEQFLSRYSLVRESTVAGRPIHAVVDPRGRKPRALIQRISDDTDDDVSIEVDQRVSLPIRAFRQPQQSSLADLLWAADQTRITSFYGVQVPAGVIEQRPLQAIRAQKSWPAHGVGAGVVAVIDTGVDLDHPFFLGVLEPGLDFVTATGDGSELTGLPPEIQALINPTTTPLLQKMSHLSNGHAPFFEREVRTNSAYSSIPRGLGHGTMVAGAVRLVAPGARILPVRTFTQDGTASLYNVIRSIHASEDRGADVINMSFNLLLPSTELARTCEELSDRGIILVASTGNDGLTEVRSYPASIPKVTGVAAVNVLGVRSPFSNVGAEVAWVSAPGEGLLLPFPGRRWAGGWGTSFSAPLVSGLAAKMHSPLPFATYSDLQGALGHSAPLGDPALGVGMLNVYDSMSGL